MALPCKHLFTRPRGLPRTMRLSHSYGFAYPTLLVAPSSPFCRHVQIRRINSRQPCSISLGVPLKVCIHNVRSSRFAQLSSTDGFNRDDGASLLVTFRGLQAESVAQGQIHRDIANDLQTLVLEPFSDWAQGYKVPMPIRARTSFNPC